MVLGTVTSMGLLLRRNPFIVQFVIQQFNFALFAPLREINKYA